jgi:hypothetical protein
MLKNIVRLEHKVDNRIFHLLCDNDAPTGHVKEALFQFLKYIGQIEDQAKTQQAQPETDKVAEEPKVEELKVE